MDLVKVIPNIDPFEDLVFYPSGEKLLVSRSNRAFELEIATGEQKPVFEEPSLKIPLPYHPDEMQDNMIEHLHFLPNRPILAYTLGGRAIRLRDIESYKVVGSASVKSFERHRCSISEGGEFLMRAMQKVDFSPFREESPMMRNPLVTQRMKKLSEIDVKCLSVIKVPDVFAQKTMRILSDIVDLVFSPDSFFLYVLREDSSVDKLDIRTGRGIESLEFERFHRKGKVVRSRPRKFDQYFSRLCEFSTDANFLVVGSKVGRFDFDGRSWGYLNLLPMHAGGQYRHFEDPCEACALSGDNQHVIFVRKYQIEVWGIASQDIEGEIRCYDLPQKPFHLILSQSVFPLAYAVMSVYSRKGIEFLLYEVNFETKIYRLLHRFQNAKNIIFGKNDALFVLNSQGSIEIWNYKTLQKRQYIKGSEDTTNFGISPTGNLLVTSSCSKEGRRSPKTTLTVWSVQTRNKLTEIEIPAQVSNICFSHNDSYLSAWYENSIGVWELNENTLRLLWRSPQTLSLRDIKIHNRKKMDATNQALISQFNERREI